MTCGTRKGFIFSVVVVSFMLLLMLVAALAAKEYAETERELTAPQSLLYASAALRDAGQEYADILMPVMDYTRLEGGSVHIKLADSLPREPLDGEITNIRSLEQGTLSQNSHAAIGANISNVTGGAMDASLMDRYEYLSSLNSSREMFLRPLANASATGIGNYSIYVNVDEYRGEVAPFPWDPGGDVNITITYTDRNGTGYDSGSLYSTSANHFSISYADGAKRLDLVLGRVESGNSYWNGALWMNLTNSTLAAFTIEADTPALGSGESLRTVLPIPLSYEQGDVSKKTLATR